MEIDDIVIAVNSTSLPESFLGRYGKVTDLGLKVTVEFNASSGKRGSMSHTAYPIDLMVVGKASSL